MGDLLLIYVCDRFGKFRKKDTICALWGTILPFYSEISIPMSNVEAITNQLPSDFGRSLLDKYHRILSGSSGMPCIPWIMWI